MLGSFDTLSSFNQGGVSPPQAPPPSFFPNDWIPIPYPVKRQVTRRHINYVKEHVPRMMKRSAEYMQAKREQIEQSWNLLYNKLSLSQWRPNCWTPEMARVDEYITSFRQTLKRKYGDEQASWRADFTIATQPIVDTYRESFIQAIFLQDQYFNVTPGPRNATGSVEDGQYPTAEKIQAKLIDSCDAMLFRTNVDIAVNDGLTTGTLICKVPWYEDTMLEPGLNMFREVEFRPKVIRHGATLNPLDLTRCLVDPDAQGSDCQKWRFIGDRTDVDYETLKSRFATRDKPGPYNLGRKEFLEKWPDSGSSYYHRGDGFVKDDPDRATQTTGESGQLQVWELHCKLHFPGEATASECICTYITELNTDDPSGGVLVRVQLEPAARIGLRPYLCWHYIPTGGPLGLGIIEQNQDIIWMLSQMINLFIDAVRFISIPLVKAHTASNLVSDTDKKAGGTTLYPGKILEWSTDPNEVAPFWFQSDLGPVLQAINYLKAELQERTSVSNASRGAPAAKRQTATEVAGLIQQAAQPLAAKLALFKENILDPFGLLAVSYLQTYVFEDQHIFVQGADSQPAPAVLTVDELRTGEYNVKAVLNIPDQLKISRAQTIMQILPILQQFGPQLLVMENKHLKLSGLIEALLKLLDIPEIANVVETVDEMTKAQLLMQMGAGQPMPQEQMPPGGMPPEQTPMDEGIGPAGGNDNMNALMSLIQGNAQAGGPVPPGQQVAAA